MRERRFVAFVSLTESHHATEAASAPSMLPKELWAGGLPVGPGLV